MSLSRLSETMLNMVAIRNLIRSAGTTLSYRPPHINGRVVWRLLSCVQGDFQGNSNTALQKEAIRAQRPKFNGHKNRNNLRTTGFNFFGRKRSIHSTLHIREGIQTNMPLVCSHRPFSQKIFSTNQDEKVLVMEIKQWIEKCKNKDGRYGNLIQIIGAPSTLRTAYLIIKGNSRISVKKVNNETFDGISLTSIQKLSKDVLSGNFKMKPVRRVMVSKLRENELRPLGVSSPHEKIVQLAIEMVLTIVFEEVFLDCSHGYRLGRNCHTALKQLQLKTGNVSHYSWAINGVIKGYFDSISHNMIIKGISRHVDCPATLNLINKILNAGYVLDSELKDQKSKEKVFRLDINTLQGIVLNSLFSNIVLHELDKFVEEDLLSEYSIGKRRKTESECCKTKYQIKREVDQRKKQKLLKKFFKVPSKDFHNANFKRFCYIRHADAWVILFAGSYKNAVNVHRKISNKLQKLGLSLNGDTTQITSLRSDKCRFLGVDFFVQKSNVDNYLKSMRIAKKKINIPRIILHAPIHELLIKLKNQGFVKRSSKGKLFSIGKSNCIFLTHSQILNYYNSKILEILNYYSCVQNRNKLWSIVKFLHYSCALTLARKFKLKSLKKTFSKFGKDLKFVDEKGEKYFIYRPANLRVLSADKRFNIKVNESINEFLCAKQGASYDVLFKKTILIRNGGII